jgi:hypothetical protein
MRSPFVLSLLCASLLVLPVAAAAEERCADVMEEKDFTPAQIIENPYLATIAFAHLKKATYAKRNALTVLGGDFPAGDAILGAGVTPADYASFQKTLDAIDLSTAGNPDDAAISSGDKSVMAEWLDCMERRGGFIMYFEPQDTKTAILHLRWGWIDSSRLTDTLAMPPGITVIQGDSCLRRYKRITSDGCVATIKSADRGTPFLAALNTEDGPGKAYWPPRLNLKLERKPYQQPMVTPNKEYPSDTYNQPAAQLTFAIADALEKQGWRFVPSSVAPKKKKKAGNRRSRCPPAEAKATERTIVLSFGADNLKPELLVCKWWVEAQMFRTVDTAKD